MFGPQKVSESDADTKKTWVGEKAMDVTSWECPSYLEILSPETES